MKQCPECNRVYDDETLKFCLDDGASLVYGPAEPKTAILNSPAVTSETPTRLYEPRETSGEPSSGKAAPPNIERKSYRMIVAVAGVILLAAIAVLGYWLYGDANRPRKQIDSIAVMPFLNETGSADLAREEPT